MLKTYFALCAPWTSDTRDERCTLSVTRSEQIICNICDRNFMRFENYLQFCVVRNCGRIGDEQFSRSSDRHSHTIRRYEDTVHVEFNRVFTCDGCTQYQVRELNDTRLTCLRCKN